MPSRISTRDRTTIVLPSPDGRTYDFTKSKDDPHTVQITVPKNSSDKGLPSYWSEEYPVMLHSIQGRCHTFEGEGLYNNVDRFFGGGVTETYYPFTLHYWQREESWQTAYRLTATNEPTWRGWFNGVDGRPSARFLDQHRHQESMRQECERKGAIITAIEEGSERTTSNHEDDLIVELLPASDWHKREYGKRHELLYRQTASMTLDAPLYPSLPSTPLPIRLLFKLPSFLFPQLLREWLIAQFLSIQLLTLYSSRVDFHPYLGSLPYTFLYGLYHMGKYWLPFAPRFPEWICRMQWTSMLLVSHVKVALWSKIGKWVLGMKDVYDEYTPVHLEDALDPLPGEESVEGTLRAGDSMV
ncbi:hypothetical protein BDV96DRAFT_654529 [Lophiotrema nucula]|uniref:Uncharacterized protein n=1 Tax=Lophiotrema nucula TaxID=690887 RepID=A0A6A5YJY7_9PLEO|nr:hypothetical protein BDV96DRAFT_654529 [Lophiotrema nucula]